MSFYLHRLVLVKQLTKFEKALPHFPVERDSGEKVYQTAVLSL